MLPTYRILHFIPAVFAAAVLFALTTVTPLAQTNQLPSPTSYITDPANVIDPQVRSQLETMLAGVKEKTKIELYVAVVETTGTTDITAFSQKLANDWKIGAKNSPKKTLLLVVCADSKSSFTQFSRAALSQLPDGVLGEMSYRMRGPLSDGRFTEAIDGGVRVFINSLAEKVGFNVAELETPVVAADKTATPSDSEQPVLGSERDVDKTRPRVVADKPKTQDPQPTETPEPAPTETPKTDPAATEPLKTETPSTEASKTEPAKTPRRNLTARGTTTVKPAPKKQDVEKKSDAQAEVEDEEETVSLTLVLPVGERVGKLKEFLDTHPESKERARAIEYLVSAHAAVGDQKLKNGDSAGGVEHLLLAIDAADPATTTDKLFSGVIAQIPTNLYLRGERAAAFKAAQNIETKFGSDPKRLLAVAGFYLGIERGDESVRLAENAIKLAPDLAEAHRMLALGYHISLRLDEAAAEYKRTLELDPASKVSRISLADLYRASGKSELALALYNEQLASDPKDRAGRAGKVIALLDLSRVDEANTELEAALTEEPRNLPLLSGVAYWFASHGNNEKAFELARKAIAIESRYTWAQIALARAYLGLKQPLDAERAMRYARQFGKFPTLNYELANVLATMGLYQESADVLRESFEIKDGQIYTRLAGHLPANDVSFIDLLAPERRAGIYQSSSPDTAENARMLKALLAFNSAITPPEGEKINESAATAAAQEFGSGTDSMRAFRQLYAANRLLRNGVGASTALELVAAAKKASDDALKVRVLTMAVQADEFRDLRARAIAAGNIPDVAEAPHDALARILKGRIADLEGWALFNQEKYPEAIERLKLASETLPVNTPAWRSALWRLGAVHEQTGEKQKALDYYIQSYTGGEPDAVRRSVIEQLYKSVNGSLDGLESRLGGVSAEIPKTEPVTPTETPKPEPASSTEQPRTEPAAAPETPKESSQPQGLSDESLRTAASRLRTNIKITGRILDANQVPLANVTVVLISPSGSVMAATTDDNGKYSFIAAPSQKTYRVIPSKDGYSFTPLDRTFAALIEDQKEVDFVGSKP
jgi:Tfp pilus assembly protein PilF